MSPIWANPAASVTPPEGSGDGGLVRGIGIQETVKSYAPARPVRSMAGAYSLRRAANSASQGPDLKKMKARIEIVGDFDDLKKIAEFLKQL